MGIHVTVWNEGRHEQTDKTVRDIYPEGIHGAIARYLEEEAELEVRTATLDQPEHGLPDSVLENTDVLIWWGHLAHHEVSDAVVEKVCRRVHCGMGLIVLHSGHYSKVFQKLTGTPCTLTCREAGEREHLWVVDPTHPIAAGIGAHVTIQQEEMYGEPFDIPAPDELVLLGWFQGGEVFRSGCCYRRGYGKIFYFQPGHETYPTYHNPEIMKIIKNAVRWAHTPLRRGEITCSGVAPLEPLG